MERVDQNAFAYQSLAGVPRWVEFTPTLVGATVVGTLVLTGKFYPIGRLTFFRLQLSGSTSLASVAGTTYIELGTGKVLLGGAATVSNQTTKVAVGNCHVDIGTNRVYLPTIGASANTFEVAGFFGE